MTTSHPPPSPTPTAAGSVLDGDPRVLIPLPEAAERLGISRWQAYKLARSGRLPTGHRVRLPEHPGQRRLAGHHPDPGAPGGKPPGTRRPAAPLGQAGQISDVVDGISFLESSPYITGEIRIST